ncbi:acrosin-like [Spea bombifrons]|uniref:acrosin-like n=1 Tax=Spea bombifrons TaxID=233779 RepID=UPI00234A046B|nr:acrosin-like [Spea bombifrons]
MKLLLILLTIVCGNRPLVADILGCRVVEGKNAEPGSWPWMVSIQEPYKDTYVHLCGGVILDDLWVLTAAHCFIYRDKEYSSWRLVFGATKLSNVGIKAQIRTIQQKIQHKDYIPESEQNDIVLLRLNKAIIFDDYTQPACLPAKQEVLGKMTGCYIAGWGVIKETSTEPSNILQEAPVNLIPVEHCNSPNMYNGAVGDYNLCAGYEQGGIDSCQGDGGGPLMCKQNKAKFYTVVGIASWGSGCGQKQRPGVYTSTQYYLEWISEHMSNDATAKARKKKPVNKIIWSKVAEKLRKAGIFN